MGQQKERGPKHRRSHSEMIVKMTGARAKFSLDLAVFIEATFAKAFVCLTDSRA